MNTAWRALVERELAGRSFEDVLVTRLREGIDVQPLYTGPLSQDVAGYPGAPPFVRGSRESDATWRRTPRYRAEEIDAIAVDLAAGTDGVWLEGPIDFDRALKMVVPAATLIAHEGDGHALLDHLGDRSAPYLVLGLDPLGMRAAHGTPADLGALPRLLERVTSIGRTSARTALVSTVPHHRAGADAAIELGIALATAAEYLRVMGVDAAARFAFVFSIGNDVFLEIAKLRAARWAWAKMLTACGVSSPPPMWIHAETSRRTLSRIDPWTNMLRVTNSTFAAAVGGADSIAAACFDEAIGIPDALGRRVARNTSIVLAEESHLGNVVDPAGGSYYVEALTHALARSGWRELQEIEAAGGMASALESGAIAARIAVSWKRRAAAIATRKAPITGVSEYAMIDEPPIERPRWDDAAPGLLPALRDAEGFEALRAGALAVGPIYLANLGPRAEHAAREGFARGFFGAGGLRTISDPGTAAGGVDVLADRFASSGAHVACLCGTDARYALEAAAEARALRARGAKQVYLAGRGAGIEGLDGTIQKGIDVIATLTVLISSMKGGAA